eukprot:3923925-Amphidinium_carterae.1
MSLEQNKNGVPQYQGNPELWQEYVERAKDLFYARIAYESVRGLAHDELITRNAENRPPHKV